MTAVDPGLGTDRGAAAHDVSLLRACRSEWTKFRSVRSTWWLTILSGLLIAGIGLYSTYRSAGHAESARNDPYYRHPGALDLARDGQAGTYVAALAVLVLGALFVTGEYGTGMIRSSLTVVPRRGTVLLAKALVLVGVVGAVTAVAALVAFLGGGAIWASHGRAGASFSDPGVLGVVAGVPLYLSLAAVFALAVGTLVRNTAAALTVLVGVFFVASAMLASWDYASYLPANAGGTLAGVGFGDALSGWAAMAWFAGYSVVLSGFAALRLRRSDV